MALGIADRKTQRYLVEERRVRHRHAAAGKIVADAEHQFIAPDRHRAAADGLQRVDHHLEAAVEELEHQASGVGLTASLGTGTATLGLEDVESADLFVLIGGALKNVIAIAAGGYHTLALIGPTPPRITTEPASQTVQDKYFSALESCA
jgi:hypothetical protein